jgi:oxygen-independent coproporphyrinogen-3 oxidase
MYFSAKAFLLEAGYHQVSRHAFVLTERQVYEDSISRSSPRLGIGAHSISFTQDLTYKNHTRPKKYIQAIGKGDLPIERGFRLNEQQKMQSWLFYYFSADCGHLSLDIDDFQKRFHTSLAREFPDELAALEKAGLITLEENNLQLTLKGVYFTSLIQRVFAGLL